MGREIENLDRRKSDREDELLALLEQREAVEAQATESEARLQGLRVTAETVASSSADELGSIAAELESKTAERAVVAQEIDPELRELYEDLRAHKKGVGAAALVDGVCQGCHERVSSVELDHLLHSQGLKRCEHCRRILIV
jgi:predicted  nucleic acid-binding Zn-ribbon protein